jgi:hypothetical protein
MFLLIVDDDEMGGGLVESRQEAELNTSTTSLDAFMITS